MSVTIEVSYFNTFWIKRLKNTSVTQDSPDQDGSSGILLEKYSWTGITGPQPDSLLSPPGNPADPFVYPPTRTALPYYPPNVNEDWFIEESRIRGGYNNTSVDFGTKAYAVEENDKQERLEHTLIYSGIYNSRTGINNTNQFPVGEQITRGVDPKSGSIQKLYAENTNLIVLQERKVNTALIDKDAIYTAEGLGVTTSGQLVIGQITPFEGNFGIAKDPGSFAVHGYNKYFVDRDRSTVLQLKGGSLNEISNLGMIDYFRDKLKEGGELIGGYDIYNKNYVLNLAGVGAKKDTVAFDEMVNGWVSFFDYSPELMTSCLGDFYTFKNQQVWKHYSNNNHNNFYGTAYKSSVTFVFNPEPTRMKTFKTINYEGSNGWEVPVNEVKSEFTGVDTNPQQPALGNTNLQDTVARIYSYDEGYYTESGIQYRAGFDRKQNTYYAVLRNNSGARPGEVIFDGASETGVKAFYATVKLQTDTTTDPNGPKQLFSVGSSYINR